MPKHDPAKLKKVSISLPFGIGSAEWEADTTERKAAYHSNSKQSCFIMVSMNLIYPKIYHKVKKLLKLLSLLLNRMSLFQTC